MPNKSCAVVLFLLVLSGVKIFWVKSENTVDFKIYGCILCFTKCKKIRVQVLFLEIYGCFSCFCSKTYVCISCFFSKLTFASTVSPKVTFANTVLVFFSSFLLYIDSKWYQKWCQNILKINYTFANTVPQIYVCIYCFFKLTFASTVIFSTFPHHFTGRPRRAPKHARSVVWGRRAAGPDSFT